MTLHSRGALLVAVGAFSLALGIGSSARAEPRFAARMGVPCATCHVNPAGGGMRRSFARDVFEIDQLVPEWGGRDDGPLFDPVVGDVLSFGADFRFAFLWQGDENETTTPAARAGLYVGLPTDQTFFPMQADIYIAAELGEHFTLYTDLSLLGSFEAFGLAHDLPGGLYLKAGMFYPPYGTRLPNHSSSVRQPIGFDPRGKDAGVELGITQPWLDLQFAVQNGESAGSSIDLTDGVSVTARAAFILNTDRLRLHIGVSFFRSVDQRTAPLGPDDADIRADVTEIRTGPFLYFSFGRFAYVGEAAFRLIADETTLDASGNASDSGQFVTYQELNLLLFRGLELTGTYEFMDRDIERRTSPDDNVHRFGAAFELFPAPYVELNLIYRRYRARRDRPEDGQNEIIAFAHLFF